jgi:hypothetical protein
MANEPNGYEALLADIDARIAKLQATREGIVEIMAASGSTPSGGGGGKIAHDAFLKMSIPEATKKYLTLARAKKSTQEVMKALEEGGLPPSKYTTVYAILRRRENQVGDIINMQGDWALTEWYPNHKKKPASDESDEDLEESAKEAEELDKMAGGEKKAAKTA